MTVKLLRAGGRGEGGKREHESGLRGLMNKARARGGVYFRRTSLEENLLLCQRC
jgi:hypothetical protein